MQLALQPHKALQCQVRWWMRMLKLSNKKAAEEKKEEAETSAMAGHDKPTHVSRDVEFADETVFKEDHGHASSTINSST